MKIKITSFALLLSSFMFSQQIDTQLRNDAGASGTGVKSGFFQAATPVNYPANATDWWHLLDVRHDNATYNFAMQFSGSFFDQNLYFRKTNNSATTAWSKVILQSSTGKVGIGTDSPRAALDVTNANSQALLVNYQDKSALTFVPNNGNSWFNISHGLNNDLAISSGDIVDYQRLVTVKNNGNVGIGTSNPNTKLDVSGNMRISNNSEYTFLSFGKDANDQLIVDNTSQKDYGGGYFFRVHNETNSNQYIDALVVTEEGKIGLGTNHPQTKLDVVGKSSFTGNMMVNGNIEAKEIKVTQSPTADFVFADDYNLPTLEDVEKHIKINKHLPEIASAKTMEKVGVNVGEFQIKLLQKIEELTLYSIEQNKINKAQEEKIERLEKLVQGLLSSKK